MFVAQNFEYDNYHYIVDYIHLFSSHKCAACLLILKSFSFVTVLPAGKNNPCPNPETPISKLNLLHNSASRSSSHLQWGEQCAAVAATDFYSRDVKGSGRFWSWSYQSFIIKMTRQQQQAHIWLHCVSGSVWSISGGETVSELVVDELEAKWAFILNNDQCFPHVEFWEYEACFQKMCVNNWKKLQNVPFFNTFLLCIGMFILPQILNFFQILSLLWLCCSYWQSQESILDHIFRCVASTSSLHLPSNKYPHNKPVFYCFLNTVHVPG